MKNSEQITEIQVVVKLRDGRSAEAIFVRREKLAEILESGDAFGNFVLDLADSIPTRVVDECCCGDVTWCRARHADEPGEGCPACPVHGSGRA
jgi:hypothetical protein